MSDNILVNDVVTAPDVLVGSWLVYLIDQYGECTLQRFTPENGNVYVKLGVQFLVLQNKGFHPSHPSNRMTSHERHDDIYG